MKEIYMNLYDILSLLEYTSIMSGIDLAGWEKRLMQMSDQHFRFSVGCEVSQDLIEDLDQALNQL
jgi:cystathionine beta-lyase/cystathionine gamma-synthase